MKRQDQLTAAHRATRERNGTTIEIYFPREAPFGVTEKAFDDIAELVYDLAREDWDPFVSAHRQRPEWLDDVEGETR